MVPFLGHQVFADDYFVTRFITVHALDTQTDRQMHRRINRQTD